MVKQNIPELEYNQEFFISCFDEKGELIVYSSEPYKFSEINMINLIKICLIEERSKSMGKKLLSIYKDSTEHRAEITQKRLELIGIAHNEKPTAEKPKNFKSK